MQNLAECLVVNKGCYLRNLNNLKSHTDKKK